MDTVEVLRFIDDEVFISGSWAGILRIYKISGNGDIFQVKKGIKIGLPIFKLLYLGNYEVLVGCGDGSLVAVNLENGEVKLFKSFQSSIIGLFETEFDRKKLLIVVESRGIVHISDLKNNNLSKDIDFGETIIDCDVVNGIFGLIFPEYRYYLGDLEDLTRKSSHKKRESRLKKDLCFIRIDPRGKSFSMIDQLGRAEYLKLPSRISETPDSKIVFPTLKETKQGKQFYHSPTAISYCGVGSGETSQCLLVANSCKNITIWNCIKKHQGLNITSGSLQESVTAVSFNKKQNVLVFATGYCWNMGISGIGKIRSGPNIHCKVLDRYDFLSKDCKD